MQGFLVEGKEISRDYSYEWVKGNTELVAIEKGISVLHFSQELLKRDLEMEFRLLRRLTETQYHNENLFDFHPDIQRLNRYNNIIPFKHSIVKLRSEGDEEENLKECYINANFINVFDRFVNIVNKWKGEDDCGYIGSFDLNFLSLLEDDYIGKYEYDSHVVQFEREPKSQQIYNIQAQCEQYWPRNVGETMICGNIQIYLQSQDDLGNNITKRVLKVTQEGEERNVQQIQWCGWPDQGVPSPSDFDVIRELLNMINEKLLADQKVVFHCSAGVGRTGTLIALSNLMILLKAYKQVIGDDIQKLEENPELYRLSIFGIVRRLREQRWGMVHTSEQYSYIYKFIDEAIRYLFHN